MGPLSSDSAGRPQKKREAYLVKPASTQRGEREAQEPSDPNHSRLLLATRHSLLAISSCLIPALSISERGRYDGAMSGKIMTREQLGPVLEQARAQQQRIVFTNGCFDLMHVGHVRYLQAARALGDLLVVGVNSDASVRGLDKGADRPIVPEAQRAEVLAALGCVDYVVLFEEPDPEQLIAALQPDILVKGGDWAIDKIVGRAIVEAGGGLVTTIPLVPGLSTTALLQRIRSIAT